MEFYRGLHLVIELSDVKPKLLVMIAKKSKKTNLENKRTLFFEIGIVLALAMALIAFEWSTTETRETNLSALWDGAVEEELDMEITRPELEKEPPPPQPIPEIVIVENNTKIPEPELFISVEIGVNDRIKIPDLPDEPPVVDDVPVFFAQEMPIYRNGGLINFRNHMQEIVKYPKEAIALDLEGTVYVKFVVDRKGYIRDIGIVRGIDPLLDNEVIAAIQQSERWKPGRQNGIPVSVAMSMPIIFRLQ
jgi:protein TonB